MWLKVRKLATVRAEVSLTSDVVKMLDPGTIVEVNRSLHDQRDRYRAIDGTYSAAQSLISQLQQVQGRCTDIGLLVAHTGRARPNNS